MNPPSARGRSVDSTTVGPRAKGALIRIDPARPHAPPRRLVFQFNPAALRRTLQPSTVGGEPGGHSEWVRFTDAPVETFSLEIEIDSRDPIPGQHSAEVAADLGISPWLYAIETMMYPSTRQVMHNTSLLAQGTLEVAPYPAPLVILSWGEVSVPVLLTSYTVTEQFYDPELRPVRALIQLEARALSYSDVASSAAFAYKQYIRYVRGKEKYAATAYTLNPKASGRSRGSSRS